VIIPSFLVFTFYTNNTSTDAPIKGTFTEQFHQQRRSSTSRTAAPKPVTAPEELN
jgi:hypothetical protein